MVEVFVAFRRGNVNVHYILTIMPRFNPVAQALRYAHLVDSACRTDLPLPTSGLHCLPPQRRQWLMAQGAMVHHRPLSPDNDVGWEHHIVGGKRT